MVDGPNVLILADIEGASGVWEKRQCVPGAPEWRQARRYLTDDVNAAVRGARQAGAGAIVVRDMHGPGYNVLRAQLDVEAGLVQGQSVGPPMLLGKLPEADCALMVGWHAGPDQTDAFSPHIFHRDVRRLAIDGHAITEVELFAAVLGEHGVPVVMVSAEGCALQRIERTLPWIEAIEIPKRQLDADERQRCHERIQRGAERAVSSFDPSQCLCLGNHQVELETPRGLVSWRSGSATWTLDRVLRATIFRRTPRFLVPMMLAFYCLRHRG